MYSDYRDKYLPSIVKSSRIVLSASLALFFAPFFALWVVYGVEPQWKMVIRGLIPWIVINLPWILSYPISYFPILGIPGTFLAFLSGDIPNLRIPCAIVAQKIAGAKPGTEQSVIMCTIGIAMSVYVNLVIQGAGVFMGQAALSALPASFTNALGFLLPALFGCVFAEFLSGNEINSLTAIVLALGALLAYNNNLFGFIPFDTSILVMLIPIIGTMAVAYLRARHSPEPKVDACDNP